MSNHKQFYQIDFKIYIVQSSRKCEELNSYGIKFNTTNKY